MDLSISESFAPDTDKVPVREDRVDLSDNAEQLNGFISVPVREDRVDLSTYNN